MRAPAAAIAWEFGRHHPWGLSAIVSYLLVLAAMHLVFGEQDIPFGANEELLFVTLIVVPLSVAVYYLLAVFSFGFAGDLADRPSVYPARLFTLPVTTVGLVGWPMLYGGLAMIALWSVVRVFGMWPEGEAIPIIWPGIMIAVLLAWTQALMWTSYGLRGMRVAAIVSWLALLSIVVQVAIYNGAREPLLLAVLTPQFPIAFLVAFAGVSGARRGDMPDWRRRFFGWGQLGKWRHRRIGFESGAHAQAWFEWRRNGHSLPILVAILLPFELALLFAARDAPGLILTILGIVMVTPPSMALFVAASVRKADSTGADSYGMTPFLATKPMTSAGLIGAKLTMAIRSTLVTWLLVLVAVPVALSLSNTGQAVTDVARLMLEAFGTPRFVAILLLGICGLVASTLKQLVQSLYVGLSGRAWLAKSSVFGALSLLTVGAPLLVWLSDNITVLFRWWGAVPWILTALIVIKLIAAGWMAVRLYDMRLISERVLLGVVSCWFLVVIAVYGVVVWIIGTPMFPPYLILLMVMLMTPLTRVAAAPLALAWNRHR